MIYLDSSATTPVSASVADQVYQVMVDQFYNPSSLYAPAVHIEKRVKVAREHIAKNLKCTSDEIYFTSGATESNNIAILGTMQALPKSKGEFQFITTRTEHPSVYETFEKVAHLGHKVHYVDVDEYGIVDEEQLLSLIQENTALVSFMHVNNEIGIVQDVEKLAQMIKQKNNQTLIHCDGVQAFGKYKIATTNIDYYSGSGHKFFAPKGVGFLMMKKTAKNAGGQRGGGHEKNVRSGTLNTPGIIGMHCALEELEQTIENKLALYRECKEKLWKHLSTMPDVLMNGLPIEHKQSAPFILNVSFMGIRGEVLLHALEAQEIYVSIGSACSSHKLGENRVLQTLGYDKKRIEGAVRFSFGCTNTEEIDTAAEIICTEVTKLRRFQAR